MSDQDDDIDEEESPWLIQARQEVERLLSTLELNPVTNEAGLVIPVRYKRDPVTWFSSLDGIHSAVNERADAEATANVPFEGGVPVFDVDTTDIVDELLESRGVVDFFESLDPRREDVNQLFLPADYAGAEAGRVFRLDVAAINEELIKYLVRHPEKMHELAPRKFEELIAELFRDQGYTVELTPPSGDGGRDILCTHKTSYGTMLTLIECKRYSLANPVGVEIVRGLYGVVESDEASHGVIATTSRFTKGAKDFHQRHIHRISLSDYDVVSGWLRTYRSKR
jgi:hypothetical protein